MVGMGTRAEELNKWEDMDRQKEMLLIQLPSIELELLPTAERNWRI